MKRNIARECDNLIAISIFAILLLYLLQYAVIELHLMPSRRASALFTTLEILVLAGGQVWKAYRLGACALTKIATWGYVALVSASVIYTLIPMSYSKFLNILLILLISAITSLLTYHFISLWIGRR
jgi:hypothetical protein